MAASEQKRLFEMESTAEVKASTIGSFGETFVGGTYTYISGTIQTNFDVIVREKSRLKSLSGWYNYNLSFVFRIYVSCLIES